ncbi:restriction endonuclease subunit S [Dickeya zeae]|uniref:restriction endonuclease subunit S n=1 Tax=Dickeya zeae TaxID=204042 RepID=UPI00143FEE6E|nr:restriction endonuclease subunit S [Dickeya zeae]QIZ45502.1 restriction endonuclease subunit S [Dickeya zeae]
MKINTYEHLKSSGSIWLGDIPTHWGTKKLKFLATVQPSNVDKKTVDGEEPIILCNYTDVYKNEYIDGRLEFMQASATETEIKKFKVDIGDVIITKDSETPDDIAVPACITEEVEGLVCGYHLTQIKPIQLYGRYLFRLFQSKGFNAQFVVSANGVTRFGLPQHAIANAFAPVPPPEEQKAIARFLDFKTAQIDALIAKQQALLDKLAEKRTALISHAVTKGLEPSAPMKKSGVDWLGDIPVSWTTKRLRFLTTMNGGMTPSTSNSAYWNGDIPWITPKDMKKDFLSESIDTLTDEAIQDTGITLHESGRVLIVVRGMILAHTFPVAINTVPATVNQDMKALSTSLNNQYLAMLLKGIQPLILSLVEQSAHGTKVLRTDIFKNIHLPVPPSDVQEKIVKQVESWLVSLDAQKSSINSVIERLREYRSALITNAVTGKIDVRGFQIPDSSIATEPSHA